jgi:hypothetical protein
MIVRESAVVALALAIVEEGKTRAIGGEAINSSSLPLAQSPPIQGCGRGAGRRMGEAAVRA